jgi:hypothetical protein
LEMSNFLKIFCSKLKEITRERKTQIFFKPMRLLL